MSTTFPTGFSDLATVTESTKVLADDGTANGLASVAQMRGAIVKQITNGGLIGGVGSVLWNSTAIYVCISSGVWGKASLASVAGADGMIIGETQGLALDFTDSYFYGSTGLYGSARIKDTTTPANTFDGVPYNLLSYTGTSKLTRQSDGVYRYGPHNLYLNSAAPANQSVTVVSGATYEIVITGTVSITWSGAYTGTTTSGTTAFTAASGTLTGASTSGSGTVAVRRTPCSSTYLATTSAVRYGLPYEWDTSGALQGILVEPQATNLIPNSTAPTAANGWSVSTSAVSASGTAPDGTNTAVLYTDPGTSGYYYYTVSVSANTVYTFSFFKKAGTKNSSIVAFYDAVAASFITQNATTTETSVGNGWSRVSASVTTPVGCTSLRIYISRNDVAGTIYVWGVQLETGSVATSPIITYGSTVTRVADNISLATSAFPAMTGSYSIFAQAELPSGTNGGYPIFVRMRNAASTEVASLNANTTGVIKLYAVSAGAVVADLSSGVTQTSGVTFKVAGSWATNAFIVCANGSAVASDTSGTVPGSFSLVEFVGQYAPYHMKKIMVIPRGMSNAELQAITA